MDFLYGKFHAMPRIVTAWQRVSSPCFLRELVGSGCNSHSQLTYDRLCSPLQSCLSTSTDAARQRKPTAMDGRGATARHAYLKLKSPNIFHARQRTGEAPRECQLIDIQTATPQKVPPRLATVFIGKEDCFLSA